MSTKRTTKAAAEPTVEPMQETQAATEPQAVELKMRRCPTHARFFADETEMRPMDEFRYNKATGKIAQTYCKRCQSKLATERRHDAKQPTVERLQEQVERKRGELADLEQRLKTALEAKVQQAESDA